MSELYTITPDHPPLKGIRGWGKPRKYPLKDMRVNGYMFVPHTQAKSRSVSAHVSRHSKALPGTYSTKAGWAARNSSGLWIECGAETPGAVSGTGIRREK